MSGSLKNVIFFLSDTLSPWIEECMPGAPPDGLSLPFFIPSPVGEKKLIGKLQDNLYQHTIQQLYMFSSDMLEVHKAVHNEAYKSYQ